MTAQSKDEIAARKPIAKRPYPGATLRYLGSVRDVTLAKTHSNFEAGGLRRSF